MNLLGNKSDENQNSASLASLFQWEVGERRENTGFEAKEMQVHRLALLFTISVTLSKFLTFPETQFLTHKMSCHKGDGVW